MKIEEIGDSTHSMPRPNMGREHGKSQLPVGRPSQSDGKEPKVNVLNEVKETAQSTGTGKDAAISNEELKRVTEGINKFLEFNNVQLDIKLNEETKDPVIRIIRVSTGETIRTVPPAEYKNLVGRLSDTVGLIFNHRV